jgi:hypothetical protein
MPVSLQASHLNTQRADVVLIATSGIACRHRLRRRTSTLLVMGRINQQYATGTALTSGNARNFDNDQ